MHQIRREKRTAISEVIVRGQRNRNWFYFNFERSSLIFNSFKTERFKLAFKGLKQTSSFVWFSSVFLSKFVTFRPQTVNRIVTALILSLLFRCFSLFLPHLRTLAQDKRSENCLCFGTSGPIESLFVSIIVAKYNIFPHVDNGRSRKKNFWRGDLLTPSACTIGILSTLTYTEFDCVALLAML